MSSDIKESGHMWEKTTQFILGKARDPEDRSVHEKMSLIVLLAWVGLGSDALSSSAYGPEEAFRALLAYPALSIFVGIATATTIFIIASSYSQIAEQFPGGGGGYLVASKLLSPVTGMISGVALLVGYVLTISMSIAASTDAIFSILPHNLAHYKIGFSILCVVALVVMNLRGVKESVMTLVPAFAIFLLTHVFVVFYGIIAHLMGSGIAPAAASITGGIHRAGAELGLIGALALFLRAYSLGAGTYTGIEAVSNCMPMLREPRVKTAKLTMLWMAASLAFMAIGLMTLYVFYNVQPTALKTLNAITYESVTASWEPWLRNSFVFITLFSESLLLFVAAQSGFLAGPRVLANMALDRWMPTQFALLSNRLVIKNGIVLIGAAAVATLFLARGSVHILIILYSLSVFLTFSLSQLGMVRHWWQVRGRLPHWKRKLGINGVGLLLCLFIMTSMLVTKFFNGGWATILIMALLAGVAVWIRSQYDLAARMLKRLDGLVTAADLEKQPGPSTKLPAAPNANEKTAVLFVNGYNGMGLHSLFNILRMFGDTFKNYVFVQVGIVDAGNFKGAEGIDLLREHNQESIGQYVGLMQGRGFHAESAFAVGTDVVDEMVELAADVAKRFPNTICFGGQLVFPSSNLLSKVLHNSIIFNVQEKLYLRGIPSVLLPIRVELVPRS